jgi:uncharacterized protein (TIGR03790 family)
LFTALFLTAPASPLLAQSAENVAVVINELSADSVRIGDHYARTRGLPATNVLKVRTSVEETIDRLAYDTTIEQPLATAIKRAGLQDRILYLVLTKGVPLRITGTAGLKGTQASVDSELTLLYRRLLGQPVTRAGTIENPYYLGARELSDARPFSHREHDIYLVTRLDAFTVEQALALIDRGQAVRPEGRIVLDQRAAAESQGGDDWLTRAASRLSAAGLEQRVLLDTTSKAVRNVDAVLGRYAWGAGDPEQRTRRTGMKFVPGSIAATLASFDARTFRPPPDGWEPKPSENKSLWFEGSTDTLIGDLLAEGVTGVSGQVGEAFLLGAVRPEILFPAYLAGFNLAEAFYLATPVLSWQAVVIGDPLCAPFTRKLLTSAELEEPVDKSTGLPGAYANRRVAAVVAGNKDVPQAAVISMVRGTALLDADNKTAAADAFRESIKAAPKMTNWMLAVSPLLEQAAAYESAAANYREVLAAEPTNIVAMNNLAFTLAEHLHSPAEALPLARRAVALLPRNGSLIDTLAWTEHLLGNDDVAAKLIEDAVRLSPGEAEIHLHAAIIYQAVGQREKSGTALAAALRLNPQLESKEEVRQLRERLSPQ